MIVDQDQKESFKLKLVQSGKISESDLSQAEEKARENRISLDLWLSHTGLVPKTLIYEAIAEIYGVPYVDLSNFQVSAEVIPLVPRAIATKYKLIPMFKLKNVLNIAMQNPTDLTAMDVLRQKTGCEIDICLGAPDDIERALHQHYGVSGELSHLLDSIKEDGSDKSPLLQGRSLSADSMETKPVISIVDMLLQQAVEEDASDIHIEPDEKVFRIRYRVDGVLHEAASPPKKLQNEIISRIKIMSNLDIAETRLPQDGRLKVTLQDKQMQMRVSTIPTLHGENVVIRLIKDSQEVLDLKSLGMDEQMREMFELMVQQPYGMILETGPTGSGKTTTLYAGLSTINSVDRNIITVEDPIEYRLPFLRQIPVNVKAGLTFATALRSILRQDPDVIMVGEIRDCETAEIAIQAALTGHLVMSTLHTNSAASAFTRLMDMKIEPFLVASSLIGVMAQRLVRCICQKCKETYEPNPKMWEALKIPVGRMKMYRGKGCRHCHKTGFKGRIGIFEMIPVNEEIHKAIIEGKSAGDIEKMARLQGVKGMREDALNKIEQGLTSAEEVIKAIGLGK